MGGESLVRDAVWQGSQSDSTDWIAVNNLQVIANAGVDVWGRRKAQPAKLSLTLSLSQPFDSAAHLDALDNSTVHYGKLSKNVLSAIPTAEHSWQTSSQLAKGLQDVVFKTAGQTVLASSQVDVFYPKGSMLGDGAGYILRTSCVQNNVSRVMYLKNVRIPCLIGVNSNERTAKQPVVVNLWIDCLSEEQSDDYTDLERVLVESITSSSFETLESLTTMVVDELRKNFFKAEKQSEANIRLRVEKPMAVPFADAPAIEIFRKARP